MLEEYEILKEVLYTSSIKNISHATVKIAFKRRIAYHLKSTFAQVRTRYLVMQNFFFSFKWSVPKNMYIINSNIYFWCILQTIVLVLVGYLTLYFDLENFNNRAMVVLTTMLVIATKTSSIQAVNNILHYKNKLISWF